MKKYIAYGITAILALSIFTNIKSFNINAEENSVTLKPWTFTQGGQYNPFDSDDAGFIDSVTTSTGEIIDNWLKGGNDSIEQSKTSSNEADGFTINIDNTGADADWGASPARINPWAIKAKMTGIEISAGHYYNIKFKIKASSKKYAYITFLSDLNEDGEYDLPPYAEDELLSEDSDTDTSSDNRCICIDTTEKEYCYRFANWASAREFDLIMDLGAFNSQYNYAGMDISDIITESEINWNGSVTISDLTIVDLGMDVPGPDPIDPIEPSVVLPETTTGETTTIKPTTVAPSKVAKPKLNKTSLKLKVGKKAKLSVKNAKGKIKWLSSKKKIAIVSSKGKVTAKKKGKCTIIAIVDGKKLKCKIKVIK